MRLLGFAVGASFVAIIACTSRIQAPVSLEGGIVDLIARLPVDSLCALTSSNPSPGRNCAEIRIHPRLGQEYYRRALADKREWRTSRSLPQPRTGVIHGKNVLFAPFNLDDVKPRQIGYAAHIARGDSSSAELYVEIFIGGSGDSPLMLTAFALGRRTEAGWIFELRDIFG